MRIRFQVPLPGPFVATSGRRRRESSGVTGMVIVALIVLGAVTHIVEGWFR